MSLNRPLRLASCMAPSADAMVRELARWLSVRLCMPVHVVDDVPWQERERLLDAGLIDLCWICGLPYVLKVDSGIEVEPCVAPVMRAARYADRPIYYSDVVVRSDSAHLTFEDLKGQAWAYNEPRSHSGYGIVRFHLANRGETFGYFGSLVEAGSHQGALRLIESGAVAGAAIDSTVLEAELARTPALGAALRVIDTFGPSPAPPWVMSSRLPAELKRCIQVALWYMGCEPQGAGILGAWGIAELRPVESGDYDLVRQMMRWSGLTPVNRASPADCRSSPASAP